MGDGESSWLNFFADTRYYVDAAVIYVENTNVMRINLLVTFFSIAVFSIQAQNRPSLSLSISNGGLIADQMASAYYFYGTADPSDAETFNETTLELDLRVEFALKEKLFFSATGGYGFYRNRYETLPEGSWGKQDQSFGRLSVGLLYKVNIEKLQIATGLEIPLYMIGDQGTESNNVSPGDAARSHTNLAGGMATGLLSTTSIRYYFIEKIYLSASMSFGPMYTSLGGGESEFRLDYVDPTREDIFNTSINNEYNSFKVTKPEFACGVGMTF
jgi:hypothetical protein